MLDRYKVVLEVSTEDDLSEKNVMDLIDELIEIGQDCADDPEDTDCALIEGFGIKVISAENLD